MNNKLISIKGILLSLFMCLLVSQVANAQGITSSSFAGRVTTPEGEPVSDVTVRAIHGPSGTLFETTTGASGRYLLSGLRVGGPYTVIAATSGFESVAVDELYAALSKTTTVNLAFSTSTEEIFELDDFVVTSSGSSLIDSASLGNSSNFYETDLRTAALVRRNVNDIARLNPLTAIVDDDRNQLTAAGQNNRYNSIMIDGVRVNDQFGLEGSGQTSLNSPVSLETVEEIAVEIAPYDVRQTGFTGAAINVVTKSGGNDFSGSVFYNFYNDDLRGDDPDGDNDAIEEITYGATFGGPIVKDKLFFFVAYEEYTREQAGGTADYNPDPDALAAIDAYEQTLGVDFGNFGAPSVRETTEEKFTAKIDWNITDDHRLALKYSTNEGVLPSVGNFDDRRETALDTNFYTQLRDEEQITAQLYSQWTDNFSTEISIGRQEYTQPTTFPTALPHVIIDDFPEDNGVAGTFDGPRTGTEYEFFMGTEQFRHANNLEWDTMNYAFSADWIVGDNTITFGYDREESDFYNLFLQGSFGVFEYDDFDQFLADEYPSRRAFRTTGVVDTDPAGTPDYAVNGFFAQNSWQVSDKLTLLYGARIETFEADNAPELAVTSGTSSFEDIFGFRNNETLDGETVFSPRLGFNYKPLDDDQLQIRGGLGLFTGRSPAVWISNAFTNNGATTSQINYEDDGTFSLADYLANDFDPDNPYLFLPPTAGTPQVNATQPGLQMPSVWRGNIAVDYRLGESDWVVTGEILHTQVNEGLWVENANLAQVGISPDGRTLWSDSRGVRPTDDFQEVLVLRNTDKGSSTNITAQLRKEYSNNWYFDASAVLGKSTDVNPFTSSRAISNFRNNPVFNQNVAEEGTSNFEIEKRIIVRAGYDYAWSDSQTTRIGLVYEGRSGRPYSAVFGNDYNGDDVFGNDLFYVPAGRNDPLVTYSATTDVDAFFQYLDDNGLSGYAGGVVPKNDLKNEWVNRFDINITHDIDFEKASLSLFANVINVGNLINDSWGLTEEYNIRSSVADGRVVGNQIEIDYDDGDTADIRSGLRRSRWAILVGARLSF